MSKREFFAAHDVVRDTDGIYPTADIATVVSATEGVRVSWYGGMSLYTNSFDLRGLVENVFDDQELLQEVTELGA